MSRRGRGLRGVNGLRRLLRKLPDDVSAEVRTEISEGAELIAYDAIRLAPRDQGDLAAALEYKLGGDKLSAQIGYSSRWKRAWRAAGWRAKFIEFGTIKHRAHPFLFPAWEMNRKDIERRIAQAIKNTLARLSNYTSGD
ncbi:MAG: HK97-gp10 family putative phage morphogenesis protein [Pseudomonadota bacterium]